MEMANICKYLMVSGQKNRAFGWHHHNMLTQINISHHFLLNSPSTQQPHILGGFHAFGGEPQGLKTTAMFQNHRNVLGSNGAP